MPVLTEIPHIQVAEPVEPMTTRQLAAHVLEFLTEENWCKGNYAIDKFGRPTYVDDESAVRWCAVGAARHLGGEGLVDDLCRSVLLLSGARLITINDRVGLIGVKRALNQVITGGQKTWVVRLAYINSKGIETMPVLTGTYSGIYIEKE